MSDYDYGDDEHDAVDSDDDDLAFVPAKKRSAYTTFGNEDDDNTTHGGKEEATYGVFMDSDNDGRQQKRARTSSAAVPMFVKGETVVEMETTEQETSDKKLEEETTQFEIVPSNEEKEEEMEDKSLREQHEAANARFQELLGRGRGDSRTRRSMFRDERSSRPSSEPEEPAGLGFTAAQEEAPQSEGPSQFSGMPSQFGGIGMKPAQEAPIRVDPNLGKWEKHTKGIGMKLLAKMGYKGSGGLGAKRVSKKDQEPKERKGISRPVEVVVRPSNLGLGFGNFKEATKLKVNRQIEAEVRGVELPKKEPEEAKVAATSGMKSSTLLSTSELLQQQSWKKGARTASRKRPRRTVVPYKELLETHSQPVVIDMRGPSVTEGADESKKEVPLAEELLHNVTVLLNTYENKLHSTSHFAQSTKRKLQSLQSDVDDMERRKREGEERILKLQTVERIMDDIDDLLSKGHGEETAAQVQKLVQKLRENFSEEEKAALRFDQVLAPSLLGPMIQARLKQWDPLGDTPSTSEHLITSALQLSGDTEASIDMKRAIFTNQILPRVKKAFESTRWDPIDNVENALQLYETIMRAARQMSPPKSKDWDENEDHHVLPSDIMDDEDISLVDLTRQEIMLDTIAPKLSRTLSLWAPMMDDDLGTQLMDRIDLWILPWIPHLDQPAILPQLIADARRKLRSALSFMQRNIANESDFVRASLDVLNPWKHVIQRETLQELTSKYVSPRLARCLSCVEISRTPAAQDWSPIDLLLQWNDSGLLSAREFLSLVEGLLSNWIRALYEWLVSMDEIDVTILADFYTEWKMRLLVSDVSAGGLALRHDDMVCRMFYSGLFIMKIAQDSPDSLEEYRPSPSNYQTVLARRAKEARMKLDKEFMSMDFENNGVPRRTMSRPKGVPATFRDVVEEFATERGLLFRPRTGANASKDGKPVFMFGEVPIYFDSDVIFALREAEWKPLSLDQLAGIV